MMLPKMTTLSTWAASLVVDFPNDNLPFLEQEDKWREWGDRLVQETSFVSNGAPSTTLFADWQIWAQAVFKSMANF